MKQRTLDEMITYFNQQVSEMDIDRKYKIALLGMITAIGYEAQKQKWIPCSERLPSDDEEVIVSILDDSGDTSFSYTTLGWHYKGIWIVDNSRCLMVKAWMPLPEPYQEVEHEKQ